MHYLFIQELYVTRHCTKHHEGIKRQIRPTLRTDLSKTYALHASFPKKDLPPAKHVEISYHKLLQQSILDKCQGSRFGHGQICQRAGTLRPTYQHTDPVREEAYVVTTMAVQFGSTGLGAKKLTQLMDSSS